MRVSYDPEKIPAMLVKSPHFTGPRNGLTPAALQRLAGTVCNYGHPRVKVVTMSRRPSLGYLVNTQTSCSSLMAGHQVHQGPLHVETHTCTCQEVV